MVGVAGFEPAASASRTQRAAKLRYTPPPTSPLGAAKTVLLTLSDLPTGSRTYIRGTSVSSVASGRQANLTGAHGEVPSPADTFSQDRP
jgi:hypothetical protein